MFGGVRHAFEPVARALAAPFLWLRIPPTAITVAALVPAGAAAFLVSQRSWAWALAVGAIASLFDLVDGAVARRSGRVTAFGGYLDSVIDRVVDLLFLFGVGFALDSPRAWALVGLCAIGSVGTSYARARAYEALMVPRDAWGGLFERPERLLVLGLGALGQLVVEARGLDVPAMEAGVAVCALGANLTFLQRVAQVRRLLAGPRV